MSAALDELLRQYGKLIAAILAFLALLHLGGPPLVEPMNPADRVFRVHSSDRTATDRLLADPQARNALSEALAGPSDEVSLASRRFAVLRNYRRDESRELALGQSLAVLEEMARVLG